MKALLLKGIRELSVEEVPVSPLSEHDVKIRVQCGLLCGTDHSTYVGAYMPPGDFPFFIGHEIAGFVEETGARVAGLKPGQLVVVNPVRYCHTCYRCRNGQEHFCERLIENYNPSGGFSEYIVVHHEQVLSVPDGISPELAAFAEPVSVCIHGIDMAGIRPGSSVAITGAGAIGLILLQLARLSGASLTLVSEPQASKRDMARRLGADHVVNPADGNLQEVASTATAGRGFDVVIEASDNPQAALEAYNLTGMQSTLIYFATYPMDFTIPVSPFMLYFKEMTIKAVFFSPYTFPRAIDMLPKLELESLITTTLPLDQAAQIMDLHETGREIKIMVAC